MSGLSTARAAAILREHRQQASERQVDLAISLRVCDVDASGANPVWLEETDEELIEVGGRWDRRLKKWTGDSKVVRIVRIPRGSDQEQPARWLAEWFDRWSVGAKGEHWKAPATIPGRDAGVRWERTLKARVSVEFRRAWTLMLVGGRRAGKSHLAVVALAMMLVLSPRAIVWAISPTQTETDELEQAMRSILPRRWFTERLAGAGKALQFKLGNGSRLLFLSGHKPRSLKRGRCDMALLNESQNMYKATWRHLRGAIVDKAGLVVLSCNPPDEVIGKWIDELYEQIQAKRVDAEAFHHTGVGNPFVTIEALESMRREVDDITAAREIDGQLGIPMGDTVFHAWGPDSIREVPAHLIDVTPAFTKKHLGRSFGYVVGMDFQRQPHEAAVVFKFFTDPTAADPEEVLTWIVDGVAVEDANEDELLDALERIDRWSIDGRVAGEGYRGWAEPDDDKANPVHCGVVMDASAWWQDSEHQKGKKSNLLLAARRWTHCYRPQKDSNANPAVAERVKTTNGRLKTADLRVDGEIVERGRRRMFSCSHNLEVNRALSQWETIPKTGQPNKNSDHAHLSDAASYVVFRFFGTPKVRRGKKQYLGVNPYDRGDLYPR